MLMRKFNGNQYFRSFRIFTTAACLLRDGDIAAAAQEERFTRKKFDGGFLADQIRAVPGDLCGFLAERRQVFLVRNAGVAQRENTDEKDVRHYWLQYQVSKDRAYKSSHRTYGFDSTPESNKLLHAYMNKQSFLYIDSFIVILARELLHDSPSAAYLSRFILSKLES
jgi:predicted NodU family carbamoyl transferase